MSDKFIIKSTTPAPNDEGYYCIIDILNNKGEIISADEQLFIYSDWFEDEKEFLKSLKARVKRDMKHREKLEKRSQKYNDSQSILSNFLNVEIDIN